MTLEERLADMVDQRVATLQDSLHVTEHETILNARLAEFARTHGGAAEQQQLAAERATAAAVSEAERRERAEKERRLDSERATRDAAGARDRLAEQLADLKTERCGTRTTRTILQKDGPNHLGLRCNTLPGHQWP